MRIIDLALKDIRQVLHDRRSLIFMLVMPIAFTFFFGIMGGNQSQSTDTRLVIGVVNQDTNGILSTALVNLLQSSNTVRPELVAEADAAQIDARIVKGDFVAGLLIPKGYSAATLNGETPNLEIINNEETTGGQTARRALQTNITRMLGMVQTAQSSLKAYQAQAGALDAAARSAYLQDAINRAADAWKTAPLSVKVTSKAAEESQAPANPYNQYSPGMIVMFTIFGLTMAAMVMVVERRTGAMARLLTTPMRKTELIAGHILGMFVVFFLQEVILVAFGQVFLKVNYLREPLAVGLVMAALALWVASLGLLVSTLSKKEDQVILFAMVGMFLFSALGGAWFSLEMVGKTFSTIGHLTPTAWAIDGFQNIISRGLGFQSVLLPAGILLAYTVAFFGISIWKFRYE